MDKRFTLRGRVDSRARASNLLQQPGDAVLVDRQGPRWLVLACPCGCGAELSVNLDRRAGPAWRLYQSNKGTTVYPSVWRDTDCESHFIIWRDKILMLGTRRDRVWIDELQVGEDDLLERVLETLSAQEQTAEEISDQIRDSEPWDVLQCCRRLCRQGAAIEGFGAAVGRFRRVD